MTTQQVQAKITVKSENFYQVLEEPMLDSSSSSTDKSSFYEQLIAANERLRANVSKIFTEFVEKARLEQGTNGAEKKRKIKDDDDENEEDGNEEDDDAESSDNEEQQQ